MRGNKVRSFFLDQNPHFNPKILMLEKDKCRHPIQGVKQNRFITFVLDEYFYPI